MEKVIRASFWFFSFCVVFTVNSQFQIGHTTITFNDPSRTGGFGTGGGAGRQIQTEIYYPSTVAGNDMAVASGQFPVIVFGHGFAMAWDAYQNIWSHYAPLGYIVAFPRTEGSLIPGPSHNDFGLDLKLVEQKIQALNTLSTSLFYQKVAASSALMGHSMGGGASVLASANNTTIKTYVGLAPAETNPSAVAAAANVTIPSVIFSGSSDGVTPPSQHHLPIYNALNAGCKTFVSIVGGAHCYFANTNTNCDFGELTSSTGISISRAEQQQRTFAVLDPWLDYILRNNAGAYATFKSVLIATPTTFQSQTNCPNSIASTDELIVNDLILYPNPTTDELFFNAMEEARVQVLDQTGQILIDEISSGQLNVGKLSSGLYYLSIGDSKSRFIKQ